MLTAAKITKQDFLFRHRIIERVDKDKLYQVCNSKDLLVTKHWDTNHENEKVLMTKYKKLFKSVEDGCQVTYIQSNSCPYGRVFPSKSLGMATIRREVRHTLCDDQHYDFDLSNAQPCIVHQYLRKAGIPTPANIKYYALNRDKVLQEHMELLQIGRAECKALFLRLFFYGTYEGWEKHMKENNLKYTAYPLGVPPYIAKLSNELRQLVPRLVEANPDLNRIVQAQEKGNKDGAFMGYLLQSYEYNIINYVLEEVDKRTDLMKGANSNTKYVIYEFDGIKFLKTSVERNGGKEKVLDLLSGIVREGLGLFLKFEVKAMDERISLEPAEEIGIAREISELAKSHMAATKKVASLRPNWYFYVLPTKEWYCYDDETNNWMKSEHYLIKKYPEILSEYVDEIAGNNKQLIEAARQFKVSIGSANYSSSFMKWAKTIFAVKSVSFDENLYLLNATNGVIDFETLEFRERKREDYLTFSLGYDIYPYELPGYENQKTDTFIEQTEQLETIFSQIWPDSEVRKLALIILASGLVGVNTERFFVMNGSGRNGKGLVHNFQQLALNDYCKKVSSALLTESKQYKTSNEANGTLIDIDKVRYVYTTEPAVSVPLQNSNIKELTGEVSLRARQMYKENQDILIHCTLAMETNAVPPLAEKALDADRDRIVDLPFTSRFVADENKWSNEKHIYPMEPKFKEKKFLLERRNAYLNILIKHLLLLRGAGYKIATFIPFCIKERTELYCNESVLAFSLFRQLFEIVPEPQGPDFTVQQIVTAIQNSEQWCMQPGSVKRNKENGKDAMKQFFCTSDYFTKYFYEHHKQKFIRGFRRRVEEDDQTLLTDFDLLSEVSTEEI